ncbi:unnamed protein product [Microthlaspi erraticum]|uniref:F-box domain-containing protein n=1 Tax=Microthlaspi erraticum TaxID=1685480 RepID=A0A6D2IRH4_9BRAS|nr:unnamed protein product [Microthlaspi erraticum]
MATNTVSTTSSSISSLPDEVLARVLSFLPTKQAASTSTLSKRWRNLFPLMNLLWASLDFDDSDLLHPEDGRRNLKDSFRDFVEKTLFFTCNPLKRFSLKFQDDFRHTPRTKKWISKALERGVSDLDLRVKMMPQIYKPPDLLPRSVYVNNTLVKLTLGTERGLGVPPYVDVDLPLLKSLSLYTVWYTTFDLCEEMLLGCPQLEELYIQHLFVPDGKSRFWCLEPPPVHIVHNNIKKLTVHYREHVSTSRRLVLCTPNLIFLDYSDYLTCSYPDWGTLSSPNAFKALLEARLNLVFCPRGRWGNEHVNYTQLMSYICDVHILHISSHTAELMYDCLDYWRNHDGFPFFKNLTTLHLKCRGKEHWKLLSNFIESSPKLEILVLEGLCGISDDCEVVVVGGNVVKVLEIQGYKGRLGELNQVKCFLCELENLEEMKVKISVDEIEHKLQLAHDLLALPKRSSKCNMHVLLPV